MCCTFNHAIADGTSFWNFFNSWAHLCRTNGNKIPVNPIYDRSLLELGRSVVRLGLDPDEHVPQLSLPPLRVKWFHFSAHTISRLKEQANQDSPFTVSSFQALCAHVWRAVTRARRLGPDEPPTFRVIVNCRPRLLVPLINPFPNNPVRMTCDYTVQQTRREGERQTVKLPRRGDRAYALNTIAKIRGGQRRK